MLDKTEKYYVYAYLDPRKKVNAVYEGISFMYEPFYIGKGYGNRDCSHLKEYSKFKDGEIKSHIHRKLRKIDNIFKANLTPIIIRLFQFIDEEEAYVTENILIESIGRVEDDGSLFNYRTGGYEGGSLSQYSKKRISESLEKYFKDNDLWNYEDNCRIPWNKGIAMTQEAKDHLSKLNTGKKQSLETILKRSISNKSNWNKNKAERWNKMKSTMKSRGYIRDRKAIGEKISQTKKGNVIISPQQRLQISNTLKEKYKSGEITTWNKGKVGGKNVSRRVKVVQITIDGKLIEVFTSMSLAGLSIGNTTSIRGSIKTGKLYKGFKWMYYEDYLKLEEAIHD